MVVEEIGVDDYAPLSKGTGIYRGCTPTTSQVQLWATCYSFLGLPLTDWIRCRLNAPIPSLLQFKIITIGGGA